jgi:hypothetical protein
MVWPTIVVSGGAFHRLVDSDAGLGRGDRFRNIPSYSAQFVSFSGNV